MTLEEQELQYQIDRLMNTMNKTVGVITELVQLVKVLENRVSQLEMNTMHTMGIG